MVGDNHMGLDKRKGVFKHAQNVQIQVLPCFSLFLHFFSPFNIAITSLRKERANFSAIRSSVRFALVWVCLFPLPPSCLGSAATCDCGIPWIFLLLFFQIHPAHEQILIRAFAFNSYIL